MEREQCGKLTLTWKYREGAIGMHRYSSCQWKSAALDDETPALGGKHRGFTCCSFSAAMPQQVLADTDFRR